MSDNRIGPPSIIPATTTKGGETEEYQCSYCKAHFDDPTTLCGLEKCDLAALSAQDTDGVAKPSKKCPYCGDGLGSYNCFCTGRSPA